MEGPLLDKKQRTFLHFLRIYIRCAVFSRNLDITRLNQDDTPDCIVGTDRIRTSKDLLGGESTLRTSLRYCQLCKKG
ncbi:hypothetical protein OXB_3194 [Bacillus sp. OxB-1]|nr:hypothetical protein OXB_3194 [Bacillus sp. OxB-1]